MVPAFEKLTGRAHLAHALHSVFDRLTQFATAGGCEQQGNSHADPDASREADDIPHSVVRRGHDRTTAVDKVAAAIHQIGNVARYTIRGAIQSGCIIVQDIERGSKNKSCVFIHSRHPVCRRGYLWCEIPRRC